MLITSKRKFIDWLCLTAFLKLVATNIALCLTAKDTKKISIIKVIEICNALLSPVHLLTLFWSELSSTKILDVAIRVVCVIAFLPVGIFLNTNN